MKKKKNEDPGGGSKPKSKSSKLNLNMILNGALVAAVHTGALWLINSKMPWVGEFNTIMVASPILLIALHVGTKNSELRLEEQEQVEEQEEEVAVEKTGDSESEGACNKVEVEDSEDDETTTTNSSPSVTPRRRDWGVLPDSNNDGEHCDHKILQEALGTQNKKLNERKSTRRLSYHSNGGGSVGMARVASPPPIPKTTATPRRLTRNMSCSSAYEAIVSDIDTPLQRALSQLSKVRTVLTHIEPDILNAAVLDAEQEENFKDHKSETSSLYSSPTTRKNSIGGCGGGGGNGRGFSPTAAAAAVAASSPSCSPSNNNAGSPYRPKRYGSSPQESYRKFQRMDSGASLQSYFKGGSGGIGLTSAKSLMHEQGHKLKRQISSDDEASSEGSAGEDAQNVDDDDEFDHFELPLGPPLPKASFQPLSAIENAIDSLLDPESLMKPNYHTKSVNDSPESQAWLKMVGATSRSDSIESFEASVGVGKLPSRQNRLSRQRSRLSSDELSSIIVTNTGKLMVESASHVDLMAYENKHTNNSNNGNDGYDDGVEPMNNLASVLPKLKTVDVFGASMSPVKRPQLSRKSSTNSSNDSIVRISGGRPPRLQLATSSEEKQQEQEQEQEQEGNSGNGFNLQQQNNSEPEHEDRPSERNGISPGDLPIASPRSMSQNSKLATTKINLGTLDDWDFDAISFAEETGNRSLYTLLWALFSKNDYFTIFSIDRMKFKVFCKELEGGYLDLPYHNSIHAADVLMSMNYLLFSLEMGKFLGKLETMSALFAAAIHDFKHPGLNRQFLVKSRHPLSILYNDNAILEQMHLAEAFTLLTRRGHEIMEGLSSDQWDRFRKLTIRMVLATDLKDHFETVTKLRNLGNRHADFIVPSNSELILEVAIKLADIGHAGKAWRVHEKWANAIQEEFYIQGDDEKRLGLPVSEFMDREKKENERNQAGFFEYIALPLYQGVRAVFPRTSEICRQARRNHAEWKRRFSQISSSDPVPVSDPTSSASLPAFSDDDDDGGGGGGGCGEQDTIS